MSVTRPASEYEELLHIVDRLTRRFPDVTESELIDLAAGELERFDGARIRAYVPVLIEGSMIRQLHRLRSAARGREAWPQSA